MTPTTRTALPLLALLAACSDAGVTKFNAAPTADITSHSSGDTVREGDSVTLRGTVGDPDEAASRLSATWVVDGAEPCGSLVPDADGGVTCTTTFAPGGGVVQLEVVDGSGESASDRVELEVTPTDAPVVSIATPTEDGRYYADQSLSFTGTVDDAEDGPTGLTVTWETEALGDLGLSVDVGADGSVEAWGQLDEGEHVVRLRAVDSTGKEGRESVVIQVGPANSAPSCAITAPADGTAGAEGAEVRFAADVGDVDVSPDQLSVSWESDVDGLLRESVPDSDGTVGFATSALSVATHRITLTVTDEVGATCTDSIYTTVGTPPTLTVLSPSDGDIVSEGSRVSFSATVSDSEDLPTELELSWISDLDGGLSSASADSTGSVAFARDDLSTGDHLITVTATDTDGLYAVSTFGLTVNGLPTLPDLVLAPDPAVTTDALTATASGSVDPDGGTVSYSFAWLENGAASAASTTAVYPASATVKHRTYTVIVTPNDGIADGPSASAQVTIDNSAPVLSGPTLSASTAAVGDVLTCSATATDADPADSPSISYLWQDGSTGPTYTVTAADTPGDVLTCTATADDGDGGTASASASATVTNTAPTVTGVTVSPSTAKVGETLSCTGTGADADGDSLTTTTLWSDGSTAATYTVQASDNPGDSITCTLTVTDPWGASASASASATVSNTDPVLGSVTISPSPATNSDTLSCTATATDADGGTPVSSFVWTSVDSGATLGTASTLDLAAAGVASLETVRCAVTATDADGGTDVSSAILTVSNRDPSVSVSISPSSGVSSTDTLVCSATASDDDGDSVTTSYGWTVNGVATPETSSSGGSALAGAFSSGDTVVCTATSTDGKGGTGSASASVTVTNDAPVVSGVTISPATLQTNTTASVGATVTDPDGDPLTVSYDWYVNSALVQSGSSTTLDGSVWFDKNDVVQVNVVASDGTDSTTGRSSSRTVQNTAPTAPTVTISPALPSAGDTLSCTITTPSTDADGDSITYSMSWDVDGVSYEVGGSTDTGMDSADPGWVGPSTTSWTDDTADGTDVGVSETWTCVATPHDGDDAGTAGSDAVTTAAGSTDFVMFVTDAFLGSNSGSWLSNRTTADAFCASEAAAEGISGSDWSIVYSTPSEDARDHVDYDAAAGDRVFDRNGRQIDNGDLWSTSSVLPNMTSWTIVSTGTSGTFQSCSGSYPSGSWPICQYCSQKFACGSSGDSPFRPSACCWTGTRSVICMGKL